MAPVIDELAEELEEVKFGKVNVDEEPELANRYGIEVIPTLVVFKDGRAVESASGVI
jgi:thioredoxin 1